MVCKFCGNTIEDNSEFCFICGNKAIKDEIPAEEPKPKTSKKKAKAAAEETAEEKPAEKKPAKKKTAKAKME